MKHFTLWLKLHWKLKTINWIHSIRCSNDISLSENNVEVYNMHFCSHLSAEQDSVVQFVCYLFSIWMSIIVYIL